jgi:hypothetical protein
VGTPAETPERPRRHPDSAYKAIGEEGGLVVLPDRREVKVLNPVAVRIYALLDGSRTVDDIAHALADEYEVTAEQAAADVRAFVDELRRNGMLADAGGQEIRS